jgi:hypothetical protein
MSQVHPCIKATVGAVCLLLSVSVTFFEPRPTFSVSPIDVSGFAMMERRVERNDAATPSVESSLLMIEVEALRDELATRSVSSPAE